MDGTGSADLENADKEGAVDDLKAEQDGGAGRDDEPPPATMTRRSSCFPPDSVVP